MPVSLRIIGIHRSTDTHNSNTDGYAGPSSAENLVFIPAGLASSLAGTDYLTEIRIQLCRIDQSDAVLDDIRETDATAMETANVITDNYEYQQKRALIFAQKNYYTVICWAAYGTLRWPLPFWFCICMLLLAVGITFIQIYRKSPNELLRGHVR